MPLLAEIKQSKPFASTKEEAILSLMRTTDVVKRRLSRLNAAKGLSAEQYNVLRILRGAGNDGLPTLEVADRLIERSPAITRLLDKLEKKTLVRRERPQNDRRQVLCFITKNGLNLLAEMDPEIAREQKSMLSSLSESELRNLIRILDKIRAGDS